MSKPRLDKLFTIKFTQDQLERLGLARCVNCGHPPNNHWGQAGSADNSGCAHCPACKEYKQRKVGV